MDPIKEVTGQDTFDASHRGTMDMLEAVDARLDALDAERKSATIETTPTANDLLRRS